MRACAKFGALICGWPALAALASAQAPYPTQPIRLVVPFAPGGSSEIIARSVAGRLSATLGQQVYAENKPGGAGNVAMEEVKDGGVAVGSTPQEFAMFIDREATRWGQAVRQANVKAD